MGTTRRRRTECIDSHVVMTRILAIIAVLITLMVAHELWLTLL